MGKTATKIINSNTEMNFRLVNRSIYTCLHCKNSGKLNCEQSSKGIKTHILKAHKVELNQQQRIKNFQAVENIDYINNGVRKTFKEPLKKNNPSFKQKQQRCKIQKQNLQLKEESDQIFDEQDSFVENFNRFIIEAKQLGLYKEIQLVDQANDLSLTQQQQIKLRIDFQKEMIDHLLKCSDLQRKNLTAQDNIMQYVFPESLSINEKKRKTKKQTMQLKNTISLFLIWQQLFKRLKHLQKMKRWDLNQQNLNYQKLNEYLKSALNHIDQLQNKIVEEVKECLEQQGLFNSSEILKQHNRDLDQQDELLNKYLVQINSYKQDLGLEELQISYLPSIPINADLTQRNFCKNLSAVHQRITAKKFDAITIDYAWPINMKTEGQKDFLNYETLPMSALYKLEIEDLQDNGYLFMWTVAQKFIEAIAFMLKKGYRIVDSICWIKRGIHKSFKSRPGFHLRHSKEICLIGLKGNIPENMKSFTVDDIIESIPAEKLLPEGYYCELFARKNNLRNRWVSVGNEL